MNEEDKLEQFIRSHRSGFDGPGPEEGVWAGIEKGLLPAAGEAKTVRMAGRRWLKAAAVLLIAGAGTLLFLTDRHFTRSSQPGGISPALAEVQRYYTRRIESRLAYIRSLPAGKTGLSPEALKGLEPDAKDYRQLQQALQENPGDQRVQAAFIQYYRAKLEAVVRVSTIINNNIKDEKENDHEKALSI